MLSPVFHFEALKERVPIMRPALQRMIARLRTHVGSADSQQAPIKAIKFMRRVTGEVVVNAFFGDELIIYSEETNASQVKK
jgi:hypothetical protein